MPQWVHEPNDVLLGTKMSFSRLAAQIDIDNVIAYFATASPDCVPATPFFEAS